MVTYSDLFTFIIMLCAVITLVINIMHNANQKGEQINVADLAASFQRAVVDCLLSNFEAAAKKHNYKQLVIAGGVSANSRLRADAQAMCRKHGWSLHVPELKYCGDNAAMVAAEGAFLYLSGVRGDTSLNAHADDGDN